MPEETIQWDKLTPEERNRLIDEKVMGNISVCQGKLREGPGHYTFVCSVCYRLFEEEDLEEGMPIVHIRESPRYTESMDDAWLVLQKIAARWDEKDENLFDEFRDELLECSGNEIYPASSLLLRMAQWTPATICLAALKAMEYDVAEEEGQS